MKFLPNSLSAYEQTLKSPNLGISVAKNTCKAAKLKPTKDLKSNVFGGVVSLNSGTRSHNLIAQISTSAWAVRRSLNLLCQLVCLRNVFFKFGEVTKQIIRSSCYGSAAAQHSVAFVQIFLIV